MNEMNITVREDAMLRAADPVGPSPSNLHPNRSRCHQLELRSLAERFEDPQLLVMILDRLEKQLRSTRKTLLAEPPDDQLQTLTILWHSLKGAAGCVGAIDLMERASAMESASKAGQLQIVRDGMAANISSIEDCLGDISTIRRQIEAS